MEKDRGDDRSGTGGEPHREGRLPLRALIPSGGLLHGDIIYSCVCHGAMLLPYYPLLYLYLYEEDRRIRVDAVVLRAG